MRLTTQVCPASFTLASPAGAIYAAKPTSICLYVVVNNQRNFSQDYPLRDGGGLFLLVRRTGSKLWRLKFGNTMRSLGAYPTISLAQARVKRDTIRQAAAGNAGMPAAPPPSPLFEK